MKLDLFDYALDPARIAERPPAARDGANLLLLAAKGDAGHSQIRALSDHVAPGTLVLLNNTRVIPARLLGHKEGSGGRVEVFLLRVLSSATDAEYLQLAHSSAAAPVREWPACAYWLAMGRASKGFKPGARILLDNCTLHILGNGSKAGTFVVRIVPDGNEAPMAAIERVGQMPLPPYMNRQADSADSTRYQTVFASRDGAVAAPTAGLHLTETSIAAMKARGATFAQVTLHVGLGTFQPVTTEDLNDHPMHEEYFEVGEEAAAAVRRAQAEQLPILAVGTTAVRAIESAALAGGGTVIAAHGPTRLLIQPGYRFAVVNRLLTNFHLPKSTLLALVSAFSGRERILAAYTEAQARNYRFFSYGDAMLLDRNEDATP
jgi:S-adenosylmethionine:tRNA ribosyltransferase-isomerase